MSREFFNYGGSSRKPFRNGGGVSPDAVIADNQDEPEAPVLSVDQVKALSVKDDFVRRLGEDLLNARKVADELHGRGLGKNRVAPVCVDSDGKDLDFSRFLRLHKYDLRSMFGHAVRVNGSAGGDLSTAEREFADGYVQGVSEDWLPKLAQG